MTCENLCTAAKCAELEARIEQLEAALQAHLTQAIPDAHDYECDLSIEAFYTGGGIGISLSSCFGNDTTSVELPFCTIEDCGQITNEITNINNEITNINNNVFNVNNSFNAFFNSFNFTIENITNEYNQINKTITNIETSIITIVENPPEEITTDCSISGFVQGNYLELFLGVGKCFASTSIFLPMAEDCCDEILQGIDELKALTGSLINQLDYRANLIEEDVEELKAISGSLINQLDYRANLIEEDVEEVKNLVSVPINGTIAAGSCQTVVLNENTYSSYEPSAFGIPYSGNGLVGLQSALEAIDNKLTSIHTSTCQAIVPSWQVTFESLLELCGTPGGGEPETPVTIPLSWAVNKAVFNILKNQKTIQEDLCELDTGGDVVSLLASDKFAPRVSSKVVVLHFVRLNDYPKRTSGTYWQAQIPLAKNSYDWQNDFQSLRWYRGNVYAELRFVEPVNPVSGFFENETRANQYFDAVLNLTNATEDNRIITLHDNPKTNITQEITRPYRAFILEPQPNGKPLCLQKYIPVIP